MIFKSRHCERSTAIQGWNARSWIASLGLAMTVLLVACSSTKQPQKPVTLDEFSQAIHARQGNTQECKLIYRNNSGKLYRAPVEAEQKACDCTNYIVLSMIDSAFTGGKNKIDEKTDPVLHECNQNLQSYGAAISNGKIQGRELTPEEQVFAATKNIPKNGATLNIGNQANQNTIIHKEASIGEKMANSGARTGLFILQAFIDGLKYKH